MKKMTFLFSILLTIAGWSLAQTNLLTTKVKTAGGKIITEYYYSNVLVRVEGNSTRTNKDGLPIAGYTKLYQDAKLVLEENWGPGPEGQRTFYRNGEQLLTEVDKDGDGTFEWIVIHRDHGKAHAVFKRTGPHRLELLGTNSVKDFDEGLEQSRPIMNALTNRIQGQPPRR